MPRIREIDVAPFFPSEGDITVALFGEAPGPRGADQSGIPFWGDRAGHLLYRALVATGRARVPEAAWDHWDGTRFREAGLRPALVGTWLSNAFPRCPTRDGHTFKAPTDTELRSPDNLARLAEELRTAAARCPGTLRVIAMGRRAAWVFARLEGLPHLDFQTLPHPSAQGLLQAAPNKGKGMKLSDLQHDWEGRLRDLLALPAPGFPAS